MNTLKRLVLKWANPEALDAIARLERSNETLRTRNRYLANSNAAYRGHGRRLAESAGYTVIDAKRDGIPVENEK